MGKAEKSIKRVYDLNFNDVIYIVKLIDKEPLKPNIIKHISQIIEYALNLDIVITQDEAVIIQKVLN